MIEQTSQELIESFKEDPEYWVRNYEMLLDTAERQEMILRRLKVILEEKDVKIAEMQMMLAPQTLN